MTSPYESGISKNVFQQLDTDCSLCVLSLCLASNDMVFHIKPTDNSEAEEKNYHVAVLLSILREVAKIIDKIDNFKFIKHFSQVTKDLLRDLKRDLKPFHDNSLSKGTLIPIRNITFHYDFTKANKKITSQLLAEIKNEHKLKTRVSSGDNSILRHRYTFADAFRIKLVNSYLNKDLMGKISDATVNVMVFTDSLLADLSS